MRWAGGSFRVGKTQKKKPGAAKESPDRVPRPRGGCSVLRMARKVPEKVSLGDLEPGR